MRKIAIPISKGHISEEFGKCSYYEVFDVDGRWMHANIVEVPHDKTVESLPHWAASEGITDIIAFKIDPATVAKLAMLKINVFLGIKGIPPREMIEAYINGALVSKPAFLQKIDTV